MVAITFEPTAISEPTPAFDRAGAGRRLAAVPDLPARSPVTMLGYLVAAAVLVVALGYLALSPVPGDPTDVDVSDTAYVARPGDSMWSIALDVAPAGTASAYVERLVAVNGTSVVEPGQSVVLPAG